MVGQDTDTTTELEPQSFQVIVISHIDQGSFVALRSSSSRSIGEALRAMLHDMQKELAARQIVLGQVVRKAGSVAVEDCKADAPKLEDIQVT
jgi:hypothetical protein